MESDDYKHGIIWMDWQHDDLIREFNSLHEACEKGDSALADHEIIKNPGAIH